jgi:outer membrane immunogenic protein
MSRLLCSTFALSFLSTAVLAADFPMLAPPPAMAPVLSQNYDWTGFYAGISGGWGFAEGEADYEYVGAFTPEFLLVAPSSVDVEPDGALVGGTVGFNLENNGYLFGVEGDISWSDITGEASFDFAGAPPPDPFVASTDFDMAWFGTLRGRVGFAMERVLIFATAGAAFADLELRTSFVSDPVDSGDYSGSEDGIEIGWTAGGGIEFAVTDRWSIKAEALYYDLGEVSATATDPVMFPGQSIETALDVTGVVARGGVNFQF